MKNTINNLRELITFAQKNNVEPKELFKAIDKNDSTLGKVLYSIDNYDVTIEDIINNRCCGEHDGYWYGDDYILTYDTEEILHIDNVNYCQYDDVYISGDIVCVYAGRNTEYWSETRAKNNAYEYGGEYYTDSGMEYHNLVFNNYGEVASIDDVYYWESDNEYHHEPEQNDNDYLRDYHEATTTTTIKFSESPKFFIGFEIEKEDQNVKESIYIGDFENKCDGWRKERDGSLDDDSGYELISPIYELNPDKIREDIGNNDILVNHINAGKSNSCGGHINVSELNLTGEELFDKVKGYNPLIYALYYGRVDKHYAKGKSNLSLKEDKEKMQAVRIHGNRIEYRIFSAVPNLDTLIWRAKLIEYIMNNPTDCPKIAFYNASTSPLKQLLEQMYKGDKLRMLMDRCIEYTLKFEQITITNAA